MRVCTSSLLVLLLLACTEKGLPPADGTETADTGKGTPADSTVGGDSHESTGGDDSHETGDTGSPPVDLPDCEMGEEDGPAPCSDCRFTQIEATGSGACGLTTDGDIACWGYSTRRPVDGPYIGLYGGGGNSLCGLRADGRACCWSESPSYDEYLAAPGDIAFTSLAPGAYHGCGIDIDDKVRCWGGDIPGPGGDDYGQADPPSGTFVMVAAGGIHTCGLREDHTLACWGVNAENDAWEEGMSDWGQVTDAPSGTYASVVAGQSGNCAVDDAGMLTCWGFYFDAGDGLFDLAAIDVSFGGIGTLCIVTDTGDISCDVGWGTSDEVSEEDNTPPTDGPYTQVAIGSSFGCALKEDGQLDCWGSNHYGALTPP